jgi:hypothetical protein
LEINMPKVFMYKDGTGEQELFDADDMPKSGYSDSPSAAVSAKKPAAKKATAKKAAPKKRARKGGKFVADDPSTPDVNEAYEQ